MHKLAHGECSISSLSIRETQIKTTMRHAYTPIKVTKIENYDNMKCCQECRETGSPTF